MMRSAQLIDNPLFFMSAVWNGLADSATVPQQLDNILTPFAGP